MKTRYLFFFVLLALILSAALPVGVVQAAGKTASLVEFKHVPGKGWTVVFKITGDWKAADLKGNTIKLGSKTFDLSCNFRDDDHISCTMKSLGQHVGKSATFFFGRQMYSATVPEKSPAKPVFEECPLNHTEYVSVTAVASNGDIIKGAISYQSDWYTINEAAALWVKLKNQQLEGQGLTVSSYEITSVVCEPWNNN